MTDPNRTIGNDYQNNNNQNDHIQKITTKINELIVSFYKIESRIDYLYTCNALKLLILL